MNSLIESIAVGSIVTASVGYLALRCWLLLRGRSAGTCSGCSHCPAAAQPEVVSMRQRYPVEQLDAFPATTATTDSRTPHAAINDAARQRVSGQQDRRGAKRLAIRR
jgi:hypothetical protein